MKYKIKKIIKYYKDKMKNLKKISDVSKKLKIKEEKKKDYLIKLGEQIDNIISFKKN